MLVFHTIIIVISRTKKWSNTLIRLKLDGILLNDHLKLADIDFVIL